MILRQCHNFFFLFKNINSKPLLSPFGNLAFQATSRCHPFLICLLHYKAFNSWSGSFFMALAASVEEGDVPVLPPPVFGSFAPLDPIFDATLNASSSGNTAIPQ